MLNKSFCEEGDNRSDYPSAKAFVDKAVLKHLKEVEETEETK